MTDNINTDADKQDEAIDTLLSDLVKDVIGKEFIQKAGEIEHDINNMTKNYHQEIDNNIAKANDEFFTWQYMSCLFKMTSFNRGFLKSPQDYLLESGEVIPGTNITLKRTAIRLDLEEPIEAVSFKGGTITTLYIQDLRQKEFAQFSEMAYWYGNKNPYDQSNIIDTRFPSDLMEKIAKCYTENNLIITNLGNPLNFQEIGSLCAFDWNFFLIVCVRGSLTGQYSRLKKVRAELLEITTQNK